MTALLVCGGTAVLLAMSAATLLVWGLCRSGAMADRSRTETER
jgi:hypothetical protein